MDVGIVAAHYKSMTCSWTVWSTVAVVVWRGAWRGTNSTYTHTLIYRRYVGSAPRCRDAKSTFWLSSRWVVLRYNSDVHCPDSRLLNSAWFFYILFEGCFNAQNTRLVTALKAGTSERSIGVYMTLKACSHLWFTMFGCAQAAVL